MSRPLPRLADVLPPGHDAAAAALDRLFGLVAREPDAPPEATHVHRWMLSLLRAEYALERSPRTQESARRGTGADPSSIPRA